MKLPIFDDGEWVCASFDAFGIDVMPVGSLSEDFTFFSINPFNRNTKRRDDNVSVFRNFLIELDKVPVLEQKALLDSLKVPYSMLTFSGSKSMHAIISLEVPLATKAEYKELARRILKAVPEADRANSNPSRFSRVPGHRRSDNGVEQALLFAGPRVSLLQVESWLLGRGIGPDAGRSRKIDLPRPKLPGGGRWPVSARTMKFLKEGAPNGRRHLEALQAAFDFAECGWPAEEAHMQIERAFRDAEPNEIENILEHCYRKRA